MVRVRFFVVAALSSLLVGFGAGTASAGGGPEYQGSVAKDPNTFIGFDVIGSGKHKKVQHLQTGNISLACDSEASDGRTGTLKFAHPFTVSKKGKFGGKARGAIVFNRAALPDFFVTIHGKLKPHGKAMGTLKLDSSGGTRCYSGTLGWATAKP